MYIYYIYKYVACAAAAAAAFGKEDPAPMFKFQHKDNVYLRWGVTAFITVVAILAVYDILLGDHRIGGYLGFLGAIITPIAYGAAIAYLLAPIVDFLERTVLPGRA